MLQRGTSSISGASLSGDAESRVVATTSYFTRDARTFQQEIGFRIGLTDYLDLQAMLQQAA
jgi:hypothetical protein